MTRDLFSDEKRSSRDFLDLTLKALRELDRTGARRGFVPCFKLWDYGPHQPFRSWLIQVPEGHREETIVLERRWDAPGDRERLSRGLRRRPDLQPTLSAREAKFPREDFDSLRGFAARIEFPLLDLREAHLSIPPAPYGIEGCRLDVVRLRTDRVRLERGAVPPAELKGVAAWVARVRSLCEGCFPDASVEVLRAGPTGLCSLCRRPAPHDTIPCPACGAAYHPDCWDYVGGCAVFGRGGRGLS